MDFIKKQWAEMRRSPLSKALRQLDGQSITSLRLSGNEMDHPVGNKGAAKLAEALKHNTSLTELDLVDSRVGDEGATKLAEALRQNTTLVSLLLRNNNVEDKGAMKLAEALKFNTTLVELNLDNNGVNDGGATKLAETLQCNSTLTKLDLSNNQVTDEGATSLAEALKQNTTLVTLEFEGNKMTEKGAEKFAEALLHSRSIKRLGLDARFSLRKTLSNFKQNGRRGSGSEKRRALTYSESWTRAHVGELEKKESARNVKLAHFKQASVSLRQLRDRAMSAVSKNTQQSWGDLL